MRRYLPLPQPAWTRRAVALRRLCSVTRTSVLISRLGKRLGLPEGLTVCRHRSRRAGGARERARTRSPLPPPRGAAQCSACFVSQRFGCLKSGRERPYKLIARGGECRLPALHREGARGEGGGEGRRARRVCWRCAARGQGIARARSRTHRGSVIVHMMVILRNTRVRRREGRAARRRPHARAEAARGASLNSLVVEGAPHCGARRVLAAAGLV